MTEHVTLSGAPALPEKKPTPRGLRIFYDILFAVGFLACLPIGALPEYAAYLSLILLGCIALSFFDDNFYLYSALFMYMRYRMLLGDSPVFRIYSYLVVIKFLLDLTKTRFRPIYFPPLFVFALHSIFAFGLGFNLRQGLNVIVDAVVIYVILLKVLADPTLLRRFLFAFLLGGITSGVFGWTADVSVDINVSGAGYETVNRNFGSLGDPNFAGLFYCSCVYVAVFLRGLPLWLRVGFCAFFGVLLLQTASLSAILTLIALGAVALILRYRKKSIFILLIAFSVGAAAVLLLLSVPQIRELPAVSGLLIRISEKLHYLVRGRFDLLTTDRSAIWADVMGVFARKDWIGKLFGGSVTTVMFIDESVFDIACHNSILQALLNFGILGTAVVYLPFLATLGYRVVRQLSSKPGEGDEDIRILRILLPTAFLIFGMSVDFFVDWSYLFFFFI